MRLELVAFDLYGTLLDVSGLAKRLEPYAGPQAADLLSSWRKAQLERTWREKAYDPFDVVTARALEEVAPRLGAQDRLRMCETWLSLPPFPDARAALESLRRARIRRAVLSNGTPAMIRAALAAADLEVDDVFSADDVRAYKPDPKVYALLRREGTLFVSANGWDAEGAKRSGLTVAWIDRGTPPPGLAPDLHVHSLGELAAAVWREQGVRVVKGTELDPNTAQTPGMTRAAAITHARAGAEKIWAGTVIIHPNAKTGAHHHGPVESVLYVVRGRAHALGRKARVHRRSRARRLHLRASVRAAPGDQRQPRAAARMRGDPLRAGAGGGEPGHRAGRAAGRSEMDRPDPPELTWR